MRFKQMEEKIISFSEIKTLWNKTHIFENNIFFVSYIPSFQFYLGVESVLQNFIPDSKLSHIIYS